MSGNSRRWVKAAALGWAAVWILFVVFHLLFFANKLEALLWVTLVSVGPIWLLTAIGGIVEVRAVWRGFRGAGGGEP
jgi:hypothetical protein